MSLQKSEKATRELSSKARTLNLRERAALFLTDGIKTRQEIQSQLSDDGSILDKLIAEGYLISPPLITSAASTTSVIAVASDGVELQKSTVGVGTQSNRLQGDNFEGKRSLATTRMFLFDICERMFVRKSPKLATQFRDQLREARDRESMMVIAREIILKVEEIAGSERADGLSERISMLLPIDA